MGGFINFTNHCSANWSRKQTEQAELYGKIEDIAFPDISPYMTDEEMYSLAKKYVDIIVSKEPDCVLCQGESVFSDLAVSMLIRKNINVVAASCKRNVTETVDENGNTVKRAVFEFERFRKYISVYEKKG